MEMEMGAESFQQGCGEKEMKRVSSATPASTTSIHVICRSDKNNNNHVTVLLVPISLGTTEVTYTKKSVLCTFLTGNGSLAAEDAGGRHSTRKNAQVRE
jgi:hypothetical protein